MANEEQRKAFAAYMGSGGSSAASAGQPIPQYPGSVANAAGQYLFNVYVSDHRNGVFRTELTRNSEALCGSLLCDSSLGVDLLSQQFPGFGVPPAVPTPPPAAGSSVVSHQGLQGGFAPQTAFGQSSFPQRPPPLGQGQGQSQGQDQSQAQQGNTQLVPAYAQLQRNYTGQPLPPPGQNIGWQYTDQNAPLLASSGATSSIMAPVHRQGPSQLSKERGIHEHFAYRYQTGEEVPSQTEELTVPVLLCHTCSICGQMRSAGYHRNHPVIPGKPIVTSPCRKCKKRNKDAYRARAASYTRIRTCTADEPCEWPREPVHVDIGYSERRGRRRDRDEIYASWRTDRLRPSERVVRDRLSYANLGLRTAQRSPRREYKNMTRVRISSLSPGRSRYDGVWPPPDVFSSRSSRHEDPYSTEVWPPPDVVPTHVYRKRSPPRPSPRIIELSPSPPPARPRTTRVSYREESEERRARSPVRRSESRVRMQSHPRPYRNVIPEHRVFSQSDDTSTNDAGSDPASRGILKPADMTYETSHRRRTSMRDSQQSTNVELGGPRVQFAGERRDDDHPSGRSNDASPERYIRHESRQYVDRPASPPLDRMERLHIGRSSPSPQRAYDEIRVDRARRISPSPPRRYEEVHFRHVSVSPRRSRGRTLRPPPSPPPLERPIHSGYRHVPRSRLTERTRSLTPPPSRKHTSAVDDMTDSEDDERGRLVEVRSWKGIDENGQPATFVEERRKVRMLDQGSTGGSEYRPLSERLSARSWREV